MLMQFLLGFFLASTVLFMSLMSTIFSSVVWSGDYMYLQRQKKTLLCVYTPKQLDVRVNIFDIANRLVIKLTYLLTTGYLECHYKSTTNENPSKSLSLLIGNFYFTM